VIVGQKLDWNSGNAKERIRHRVGDEACPRMGFHDRALPAALEFPDAVEEIVDHQAHPAELLRKSADDPSARSQSVGNANDSVKSRGRRMSPPHNSKCGDQG
jgi:hypothetical protein